MTFDAKITLSLILEAAVDTAQEDLMKFVKNLTADQIEEIINIAPLDSDTMREALTK